MLNYLELPLPSYSVRAKLRAMPVYLRNCHESAEGSKGITIACLSVIHNWMCKSIIKQDISAGDGAGIEYLLYGGGARCFYGPA